ncbi:MAG: hypothetical protein K8T91_21490 [Planctomycetes bacterium]|nr:hypothetical protein [Planctomycetota bacterium]
MADLKSLTERMDAEFAGFKHQAEDFQVAAKTEYEAREARFRDLFVPATKRVVELIRPRLQLLVDRFKDRVNVKPVMTEHTREVELKFDWPLARIALTFGLTHDADVKNLVLEENLKILPILMKFDDHSSLSMPLDKIDDAAITQWFDDRIVKFVQTVAAIAQNQYYLKDHLVTDPVAGVQMPKYAAKTTLEVGGTTHYFISEETKREFENRRAPAKT